MRAPSHARSLATSHPGLRRSYDRPIAERNASPEVSSDKLPTEAFASYLDGRFAPSAVRDRAWRHITAYLSRWWEPNAHVVDVGAGYCSFINNVAAARRVAVDVHGRLADHAAPDVECVEASTTSLSDALGGECFDVVFASNLLEHLTRTEIWRALAEFHRVLKPGGRLLLVQPNFRLSPARYFDDYTHVTPLSDVSLSDLVSAAGYELLHVEPRFLPLTVKTRGSRASFLVPLYLRSPWRPLAGQMLVVAERPRDRPSA